MNIKISHLSKKKKSFLKSWLLLVHIFSAVKLLSHEFVLCVLFGGSRNNVHNMTDCQNSFSRACDTQDSNRSTDGILTFITIVRVSDLE
jgi:hypothetical protein